MATGSEQGIFPCIAKDDTRIMSVNLLLEDEDAPVIWRGPIIAGVVKQFWTDVIWDDLDYLFVDMPPGTGDVPLTVFQSLPVDGVVIVTSPQDLVQMIVKKAYNMAKQMDIPVLGIVENYSYVKCPDCGKELKVFGESHIEEIAEDVYKRQEHAKAYAHKFLVLSLLLGIAGGVVILTISPAVISLMALTPTAKEYLQFRFLSLLHI